MLLLVHAHAGVTSRKIMFWTGVASHNWKRWSALNDFYWNIQLFFDWLYIAYLVSTDRSHYILRSPTWCRSHSGLRWTVRPHQRTAVRRLQSQGRWICADRMTNFRLMYQTFVAFKVTWKHGINQRNAVTWILEGQLLLIVFCSPHNRRQESALSTYPAR